ncbi:hypothetical protein L7F22_029393 [Adiantum nelumboides]|nr:hypothetical protein [Adiantum nelumboides]
MWPPSQKLLLNGCDGVSYACRFICLLVACEVKRLMRALAEAVHPQFRCSVPRAMRLHAVLKMLKYAQVWVQLEGVALTSLEVDVACYNVIYQSMQRLRSSGDFIWSCGEVMEASDSALFATIGFLSFFLVVDPFAVLFAE